MNAAMRATPGDDVWRTRCAAIKRYILAENADPLDTPRREIAPGEKPGDASYSGEGWFIICRVWVTENDGPPTRITTANEWNDDRSANPSAIADDNPV